MAIEIEKKFKLNETQFGRVREKLEAGGEMTCAREFESNLLFSNDGLREDEALVRIRQTDSYSAITFKKKMKSDADFKSHIEHETRIEDPGAAVQILEALGVRLVIEYEKFRTTYNFAGTEVVLDELPFGLFIEIEGDKVSIEKAQDALDLSAEHTEMRSYPYLTTQESSSEDTVFRAKFSSTLT